MRRILSLVIAGAAGGLIVLIGLLSVDHYSVSKKSDDAHFAAHRDYGIVENIPQDFTEAANLAMPAVVHISVKESASMAQNRRGERSRRDPFSFFFGDDFFGIPRNREGKGSGVIISEDGYIVTNNHVIEMTDQYEVTLYDDRKYSAVLVGSDPRTDLAVLKIDAQGLDFLRFADSDEVEVGQWVLAVGNPFDLTSTVTAGIVSAKGRHKILKRNDAIEDFIQTDAVVNPGNSGGALVNARGDLIGINTAIATATGYYAGYSFAIPSAMADPIVRNLIEFGGARVSLGVYVAELSEYEEHVERTIDLDHGVVVDQLVDGGAAQYAGILPEDIITHLDVSSIKSVEDLIEVMKTYKIGDEVIVTLYRNGEEKKISVRLKAS